MVSPATVRRHLDARLSNLPRPASFTKPRDGWIRAIRQALGMSAADLGHQMGLSRARVAAIEHGEARGNLNVQTLHRAAEALGCDFVYAFIPKKPLEDTVRERALQVAAEHMSAVRHTMTLENQGIADDVARRQLNDVADELARRSPRKLWKRRSTR